MFIIIISNKSLISKNNQLLKMKLSSFTQFKKITDKFKNKKNIKNSDIYSKALYKNKSALNIKNNESNFSSLIFNSSINEVSPNLDWKNYKSIYNHLISYINLMIINLNKDNNKICRYLKEVFLAIFKISQNIKNNNQSNIKNINTYKYKNKNYNKNFHNNSLNKKDSSTNIDWNFITGEISSNNGNNNKEEINKEKMKKYKSNSANIDKIEKRQILTPRLEKSKIGKNLEIYFLEEKLEKLTKKYKKRKKQCKIDTLSYLFKINEQNKIIKNLEEEIKSNLYNQLPEKDINEIKFFPDYKKIYDYKNIKKDFIKKELGENNKNVLSQNISKNFFSHKKIDINENSKKWKKCNNLNDIISKNLFRLRNKGKINKSELKKFNSLSLSETRSQVQKIMLYQ